MLIKDRVKRFLSQRSGVISTVLVIMLALSSLSFSVTANKIVVTVEDGQSTSKIETKVQTVKEFLKNQGITLGEDDAIEPPLDTKLLEDTTITIARAMNVTINVVGEGSQSIYTNKRTVGEVLKEANVVLGEADGCMPGVASVLIPDLIITVRRAVPVTVNVFGEEKGIMTSAINVESLLQQQGIVLEEKDYVTPSLDERIYKNMYIKAVRVTETQVVENRPINFETEKREVYAMHSGQTRVITEGVPGLKTVKELVRYENGVEVKRTLLEETVIQYPITKVMEYGTRVTPVSAGGMSYSRVIDVEATAYTGGGITASGRKAQVGVIAVDPKVIPMGTRMYIETADGKIVYGLAVAGDTGGAIKGNIIDLYYNTYSECINFGRRACKVYILD